MSSNKIVIINLAVNNEGFDLIVELLQEKVATLKVTLLDYEEAGDTDDGEYLDMAEEMEQANHILLKMGK